MNSLLVNCQAIAAQIGLQQPAYIANSTDVTSQQLLAFMNLSLEQLSTEIDWQFLAKEYRFSTVYYQYTGTPTANSNVITALSSVAGITTGFMASGIGLRTDCFVTAVDPVALTVTLEVPAQTSYASEVITFAQMAYNMPADFARIVNRTAFNKDMRWSMIGPKSPQEWQWLKASYLTNGPRQRYRIMGNLFEIWPMPTNNQILGFEYQSNGYVQDTAGNSKSTFTADTDVCLFPDILMQLCCRMFFMEQKGMDTTAVASQLSRYISKFKAQNAGADILSMAPQYPNQLLSQANLPDTGFGNTTT